MQRDSNSSLRSSQHFGQAHASGASMHGFFAFHQCLKKCIFLFELEADSLEDIANVVVDKLYEKKRIDEETKPKLIQTITAHHHHAMTVERHAELMAREKRRQKEREKRMAAVAKNRGRRGSWVQGIKQITQKLKVSSAFNSASNSRAGSRANSKPPSPVSSQNQTPRSSRTPSLNEKEFGSLMGDGEMEMSKLEGSSDDDADKLAHQAMQKIGIGGEGGSSGTGMKRNSSFGKLAGLFGGGGGSDSKENSEGERIRSDSRSSRRNSLTLVPTGEDEELVDVKDEVVDTALNTSNDDGEDDDDAFDVMVGR